MVELMEMFFGKKRRRRTSRKSGTKSEKPKYPKGLTLALRKKARKLKVKTRIVRNGKHVGYRKVSHIKRDIRRKEKAAKKKKAAFGARKKRVVRRRRARRSVDESEFGVGGSYMPLSTFSAPYPYSVDASPPWI